MEENILNSQAAQEERAILGMTESQQAQTIQSEIAQQAQMAQQAMQKIPQLVSDQFNPSEDAKQLANLIYAEVGNQKNDVMKMVGSTVLNRVESGRVEEFGRNINEVIYSEKSPYYASYNNTKQFQQALTGKFPDKISERAYKKSLQIANGLIRGTIERHPGMFFFEGREISSQKRKKKGGFNFKIVKGTGKVGKYHTFAY